MTSNMHVKHRYHKAVTVSDEAFLWQVLTVYPTAWFSGVVKGARNSQDTSAIWRGDDESAITATTDSVSASTSSVSSGSAYGVAKVSGKKKKGPTKGFTETAGKTITIYKSFLERVGESRRFDNTKLWNEKLMQIARTREKVEDSDICPRVNTIAPICSADNAVFTRYAEMTAEDVNGNFEEDSDEE